jgi:hypothetical protein
MFLLNTILAWNINIIMNKKYDNNNIIIASRAYFLQRGRRFMADERRSMAAMDAVREANRQNVTRVTRTACVAAEEAAVMAVEEATTDVAAEVATPLEMTATEQAAAHAAINAQEAGALAAVGVVTELLRADAARMRHDSVGGTPCPMLLPMWRPGRKHWLGGSKRAPTGQ